MNKNIKKLVLTTAGLTLGMVAVGNMSAETNVAMASEYAPEDGIVLWDNSVEPSVKDWAENGRTLTGRVFLGNAKIRVMYDIPVQDIFDQDVQDLVTAPDGSFSYTVSKDVPEGNVSVMVFGANGQQIGLTSYWLEKGLIADNNGGDVTPEPEKPTPTPDFSTNTWEQNGSNWYCYDSNGYKITGWMQDGNNWYYFNQDGTMHKGWLESNGLWYSFRDNGQMKRGWEKINGTQYFFTDSGRLAYDEWLPYGSDWFYVNKKGRMLQNEWQPYNGAWFYFDAKGAMVTNQYVGGSYVDASGRAI